MITNNFETYIEEMSKFAKKHKLKHKKTDRGITIRNAKGEYNIQMFITFDKEGRTIINYGIAKDMDEYVDLAIRDSEMTYDKKLGYVQNMNAFREYINATYPNWLYLVRSWKSRSAYN